VRGGLRGGRPSRRPSNYVFDAVQVWSPVVQLYCVSFNVNESFSWYVPEAVPPDTFPVIETVATSGLPSMVPVRTLSIAKLPVGGDRERPLEREVPARERDVRRVTRLVHLPCLEV
jgi:hypothetical protein